MSKREITPVSIVDSTERIEADETYIEVGQWYWVGPAPAEPPEDEDCDDEEVSYEEGDSEPEEWLGCVINVGSNFVELEGVYRKIRMHMDAVRQRLRRAHDYAEYIEGRINKCRQNVRRMLGEVKDITARLGVSNHLRIDAPDDAGSRDLAVMSSTVDTTEYKNALIKAKEETLPELLKAIKSENKELANWMTAETIPMKAQADIMKDCVGEIDDRIFNVSLYAGLTEEVVQVAEGKPAAIDEKLRLFQRLCFMDEECLVDYRTGGMDIKSLEAFDEWLAEPKHRDRIMPFPRCIVAFQVRRNCKERGHGGDLETALINVRLEKMDKLTFMYIRNGENLYRMNCDLDFGTKIFPDKDRFDPSEEMVFKMRNSSRVDDFMSKREWEDRVEEFEKKKAEYAVKHEEWKKANPDQNTFFSPYSRPWDSKSLSKYRDFTPDDIYYDEAKKEIENRIKYYNRIVLIIQGLLDRSLVLHPHPPVKLWEAEGFQQMIDLIYDGSNVLHYGEAPDFEAYRQKCNATLKQGSVVIGQDDFWQRREAAKENARRNYRYKHFSPYGDPGPGYVATIDKWMPRARKAVFRWQREKRSWMSRWGYDPDDSGMTNATVTVPADKLFNVDAYKPGDFRQFFEDPRTRAQYLKWAPFLLAAEEYHAGNPDYYPRELKEEAEKARNRAKRKKSKKK